MNYFFRGTSDASYKLYNSAQRIWITTEIDTWNKKLKYEDFLDRLLTKAKEEPLFRRVFEFYKFAENRKDFPLLSILQHYNAFTPLIDWTYDLNVALFFGTEGVVSKNSSNKIENYFSIYIINKNVTGIQSLSKFDEMRAPSLKRIFNLVRKKDEGVKQLFYLSDHEDNKSGKPLTTIFNQNIIPQKGLFIFNPSPTKPLEEYFEKGPEASPEFAPFMCYNIRKDLAEYIRRKIAEKGITKGLIYPEVINCSTKAKENTLNSYFQEA